MDCVRDILPCFDLIFVVDAWRVCVAGGAGRDEGSFGDEESAGEGGPLGIVLCGERGVDVGISGAIAG